MAAVLAAIPRGDVRPVAAGTVFARMSVCVPRGAVMRRDKIVPMKGEKIKKAGVPQKGLRGSGRRMPQGRLRRASEGPQRLRKAHASGKAQKLRKTKQDNF